MVVVVCVSFVLSYKFRYELRIDYENVLDVFL